MATVFHLPMMTNDNGTKSNGVVIDENILTILDVIDSKDNQDANDDKLSFLKAVWATSILRGCPPTRKIYETIFQVLRSANSMELIMESYWILNELDKHFPCMYISTNGHNSTNLVVVEEAWWPSIFNVDSASYKKEGIDKSSIGSLDALAFHLLVQELGEVVSQSILQSVEMKKIRCMMLFQYVVAVLERDFLSRNSVHAETMDWIIIRECLLSKLLSSRRMNYKSLMKDCFSTLCGLSLACAEYSDSCSVELSQKCSKPISVLLLEISNNTIDALQKLLTMILDLDSSRKNAAIQCFITRADGVRIPLMEMIVDELSYNTDMISPFLQTIKESKWKMEIIVQYFSKYNAKHSLHTRRSADSMEDATFAGVLKVFLNVVTTRNIIKKIDENTVQVLLAYAFQAYLSMSCLENVEMCSLLEICKNMISTFSCLRKMKMKLLPVGKEALLAAMTIMSANSQKIM